METTRRLKYLLRCVCASICIVSSAAEVIGEVSGERRRRRRPTKEATTELSQDLVMEILLRLPVKSLVRFKCVCKHWYELIRSPNFITAHYKTTSFKKKVSIFYCDDDHLYYPPSVSLRIFDVSFKLVIPPYSGPRLIGCYNGLVCLGLSRDYHHRFALWNPATTESRIICFTGLEPNTSAEYYSGFCFDSVANTHKILRIRFFLNVNATFANMTVPKGQVYVIANVHTLGDDSWRMKKLFAPCRLPNGGNMSRVTYLMRFMCWIVSGWSGGHKDKYILCLDMVDEEFKLIELPCSDHIQCGTKLADYRGFLAMFVWENNDFDPTGGGVNSFDMWVLNDCDGGTWCKQLTLRPRVTNIKRPLGFFTNGDIDFVILSTSEGCLLWDKESGETNNKFLGKESIGPFFVYSESFASVY